MFCDKVMVTNTSHAPAGHGRGTDGTHMVSNDRHLRLDASPGNDVWVSMGVCVYGGAVVN